MPSDAQRSLSSRVVKGALAGALGGLAGSFAMSQFAGVANRVLVPEKKRRPYLVKGAKLNMNASPQEWDAALAVANRVSNSVLDRKLSKRQQITGATLAHYAVGSATGALYGALSELVPEFSTFSGILFALGVWGISFQFAMPKTGVTKPLSSYSAAMQADSAGEHVVFGLATELVRGVVRDRL